MTSVGTLLLATVLSAAGPEPRVYLSIDYARHGTLRSAVVQSFAPTSVRANAGAVLFNTVHPLSPLRYLTAVIGVEAQRQLASDGRIDIPALIDKLHPKGLVVGYFGGQLGDLAGAATQSLLARAIGPWGGIVGFMTRPVLWYLGSSIGIEVGRGLGKGGVPIQHGLGTALREFKPVSDVMQMVGDNVAGVVGQALIPMPVVGNMVGGAVGGLTALLAARAFVGTPLGERVDGHLKGKLGQLADALDPRGAAGAGVLIVEQVPVILGPAAALGGPPVAASGSQPGREGARVAYGGVVEALRAGDREAARRAFEEYRRRSGRGEDERTVTEK